MVIFPIRNNIFSFLILLGTVQGFVLAFFFLQRKSVKTAQYKILGLFLLSLSFMILEIFLNYTGYLQYVIWLDNFSEPFNFVIGPFVYLFIYTSSYQRLPKQYFWHFAFFIFYCFYHLLYVVQPPEFKFNSFASVYHPEYKIDNWHMIFDPDPLQLRRYVNELLCLSLFVYTGLSFVRIKKAFKSAGLSFMSNLNHTLQFQRNFIIQFFISILLIVAVKVIFGRDLGDYFVASYAAILLYLITFSVLKQSLFFQDDEKIPITSEKYKKSPLTESDKDLILQKLRQLMKTEKIYLNSLISLSDVAKRTGIPKHHVSQVINEKLNQSFFDFLASYRVQEAKELLKSTEPSMLTIEEIADRVGYSSKSAFNKVFKACTGQTPSQYRNNSCK